MQRTDQGIVQGALLLFPVQPDLVVEDGAAACFQILSAGLTGDGLAGLVFLTLLCQGVQEGIRILDAAPEVSEDEPDHRLHGLRIRDPVMRVVFQGAA